MKITIKTLQQKVFQIDAELTDTVADLKAKIQETQGHSAETMKIIYSGKILQDSKTVESLNIKEKDFLVVMVSKPKPTPTPLPATSSSTPAAPAPVPDVPASSSVSESAAPSIPATSSPAPMAPSGQQGLGDMGSFLSGDALQSTINNMVEMGFPRDQVLRALRASYNNADRAVEYLTNGIPSHLEGEASGAGAGGGEAPSAQSPVPASTDSAPAPVPQPQPAVPPPNAPQNLFQLAQQQQQQQGGATGVGGGGNPLGGGGPNTIDIAALRDSPQIQQLRELIAQNPALVQPLIQQLATSNPAIAQAIAQNPQALFQLLGNDGGGDDGAEGGIPPGAHVVSVTEEERAAIERLEALGFPRQTVIEAYFACDKNEELAANYLFENGFED